MSSLKRDGSIRLRNAFDEHDLILYNDYLNDGLVGTGEEWSKSKYSGFVPDLPMVFGILKSLVEDPLSNGDLRFVRNMFQSRPVVTGTSIFLIDDQIHLRHSNSIRSKIVPYDGSLGSLFDSDLSDAEIQRVLTSFNGLVSERDIPWKVDAPQMMRAIEKDRLSGEPYFGIGNAATYSFPTVYGFNQRANSLKVETASSRKFD